MSPAALPDTQSAGPQRVQTPEPRLELAQYDMGAALRLEAELGVSHVLSQVLVRRGLGEPTAARRFLHAEEHHEPGAMGGIEAVTALVRRHIRDGSAIVVHGDYDVDGVCATAVMVRALRTLGAAVSWFIPGRLEDGYGVSLATVERLAARRTGLLLTVDCGITAAEPVAAALAAGMDVAITDHHAPPADGRLPDCPILHPGLGGYPCAELCGTAVAFKLAQALGAGSAGEDLELVALATVADLMPLKGENRSLVRSGLRAMANTTRPGLRELMEVAGVDPSALSASALGFRLAPRINAAGRLRRADAALELLLTEDAERAREIAAELDFLNGERRGVEERTVWEAEAQVQALGPRSAYVLAAAGWHPGVIGIVASRIGERYHRPAILIAVGEDGVGHGSGRGIPGFDLLGALHGAAGHLERYGGHRAAAGLTIRGEEIERLRSTIEAHADEVLSEELLSPVEQVDAVVCGRDVGLALAEELELLEPCGMGNPAPRILIPGARFGQIRAMGEGRHARFSVSSGGTLARAVAFGCDGRLEVEAGEPADAVFRLERNVWNGTVEPRLVLRRAHRCRPAQVEVLGEPESFFSGVLQELGRPVADGLGPVGPGLGSDARGRQLLDRRGQSPMTTLVDACASGDSVLAVCADVPRRLPGLSNRVGGFALSTHHAAEQGEVDVGAYRHLVILDPPAGAAGERALCAGEGFTHLAWGEAELRFAQQMHELEYGLRTSLAEFYRSLRPRRSASGGELERLLRGERTPGRPARLAARLIRVLTELELVSLDRDLPALEILGAAQTALDRSRAFRAYNARYEDGRRFLKSQIPRASG